MLFNILGLFSFLTDLLPLVLILMYWRVTKSPPFAALFVWTIFSILSDVAINVYDDKSDQVVAYVAVLAELMFISILYFLISKRRKLRFIYLLFGMVFVVIGCVKLIRNPPNNFDYLLASLSLLNVLVLSLLLLYEKFSQSHSSFLLSNSLVWFPLAYIIYCSGNLFLFATTEHFPDLFKAENTANPWSIFLMANIIKNTLFCKAIMLEKKKMYVRSRTRTTNTQIKRPA